MAEKKMADTPLARWLDRQMAEWQDPETGRRGLSGRSLAAEINCAQSMIWKILKQGAIPGYEILISMGEFFEVGPIFMFRLAYLESEGGEQFSPEARAEFAELEGILEEMPAHAQGHLLRSLVAQAKVLREAMDALENQVGEQQPTP